MKEDTFHLDLLSLFCFPSPQIRTLSLFKHMRWHLFGSFSFSLSVLLIRQFFSLQISLFSALPAGSRHTRRAQPADSCIQLCPRGVWQHILQASEVEAHTHLHTARAEFRIYYSPRHTDKKKNRTAAPKHMAADHIDMVWCCVCYRQNLRSQVVI